MTDNRNRTAGEVRKIFERNGGNMGSAGCVAYLFERKGIFSVNAAGVDEDALMEIVLEAGADDMKRAGSTCEITCDPAHFNRVQEALQKANVAVAHSEITQFGKTSMDLDAETARRVLHLMEALDDHDDVQNVYSNLNVTEELMAEVARE